ncbi:phospholipase D-like domain-containing protein [Glutamicibacter nicotianae]
MKIPTKISALALAATLSVTAIPAANAQLAGLSISRSINLQDATYKQAEVPCAQAPEVQVETGAVFSDPLQNRAGAVAERLCSYFKQADTGSTISLAAFVISGASGEDYVNELLAAYHRGVNVQVVIDGWQISSAPAARLINALGTDIKAKSWVAVCKHESPEGNTSSCQGTKGMHNKFALFSSVSNERNVVVQSSANVTDVNHTSYWNNALTVKGDEKLYRAYKKYHKDLSKMTQDPDYYKEHHSRGEDGFSVARFFPSSSLDPVSERLSHLDCIANETTIAVGISEWDSTRTAIAEELARLSDAGCNVSVVAGPVAPDISKILNNSQVPLGDLSQTGTTGRIHSKFFVVDKAYDDSRPNQHGLSSFVFTGSHNYNETSLKRNDEAILELHNQHVVQQYMENNERLWEATLEAEDS